MFNIKTIIIVIVVVILAFVGYGFLISGKDQGSASGVTKQAVTTSSNAQANSTVLDGPGKEFVTQLLAIQNIKFNLQLFADPVFQGLQDWSREILPQETGRPNPFAPLESEISSQSAGSASFSGNIGSASVAPNETATSSESEALNTQTQPKTTTPVRTTNTKPR